MALTQGSFQEYDFNRMVVLTYRHVSSNSASFDCVTPAS